MRNVVLPALLMLMAVVQSLAQVIEPPVNHDSNATGEREVSWRKLLPNFASDQKKIWLFPAQVAQGQHVLPTFAVLGVTAGLVAADPIGGRYFRRNASTYHDFNRIFTGTNTTLAIFAVPSAFYLTGLARKDEYAQHTALLSLLAVADVEVPNVILRLTTRRIRPADVPLNGNFADTWFDSGANPLKAKGSFASGHAASAFAIATVVSRRYSNHRWVPWVAYGTAGLLTFSRVSTNAHFMSDAFFGGALGYSVGRFVALRQ